MSKDVRECIRGFFAAVKTGETKTLKPYIQKTWLLNHYSQGDLDAIIALYDGYSLKRIVETYIIGKLFFSAKIEIMDAKGKPHHVTCRLIKEEAAFKPCETGTWGINPVSFKQVKYKKM